MTFNWMERVPRPEPKRVLTPREALGEIKVHHTTLPGQLVGPTGAPLDTSPADDPSPIALQVVQVGLFAAYRQLWGGEKAAARYMTTFWWLRRGKTLTSMVRGPMLPPKGEPHGEHQSSLVLPSAR